MLTHNSLLTCTTNELNSAGLEKVADCDKGHVSRKARKGIIYQIGPAIAGVAMV